MIEKTFEKLKINGYADTIERNIRRVERCHVKITLRFNQPNRSGLEPCAIEDAKNKFVNLWRDCPVPKGGGYLKRSDNLRALGTPLKDTLEAVMEEQQTPFADNLAAMKGQSVPARNLPEQLHEPETRVTKYGTDDYGKLYAPTKETALKDTIEAVKEREEDRSR